MPRSDMQRAASRLNGARSRGPNTPAGRLIASRNALKHGLSGEGKNLPPEMETQLASEISLFSNQFHPRTPYEHDLIRRAALGNLRSRRIAETLNALTDDRIRSATRAWDDARASELARLASEIGFNPTATLQIRQTAEGCDLLGDALEALLNTLETHQYLDRPQSRRLLNLLGHLARPDDNPNTFDPSDPLANLWACLLSLRVAHDPTARFEFLGWPNLEAAQADLPNPSDALTSLQNLLRDEIATLETEGNHLWETHDLPSRQSAPARAAFDSSPELTRLDRYLRAAERLRRQSLDELARLRRDQPADQTPRVHQTNPSHNPLRPNPSHTRPHSERIPPVPNKPATPTPSPEPRTPKPLTTTPHPSSTTSSPLSQPSPPSPSPSADPHRLTAKGDFHLPRDSVGARRRPLHAP